MSKPIRSLWFQVNLVRAERSYPISNGSGSSIDLNIRACCHNFDLLPCHLDSAKCHYGEVNFPIVCHITSVLLRGRPKKKFGQKSELSDSAETPPPLVKSDTLFKNIFIAFLNFTAFVCYLEINLFFFPPKNQKKNLENFRAPSLLEATRN